MRPKIGEKKVENEQKIGGICKHVVGKMVDGVPCFSFTPKLHNNTADIYITRMGYHFRRKIGGISPKIAVLPCREPCFHFT